MLFLLASSRLQHPCQSTNCFPVGLFGLDNCPALLHLALHGHGGGHLSRVVHHLIEQHLPDRCPLALAVLVFEDAVLAILALAIPVQPARLIFLLSCLALVPLATFARATLARLPLWIFWCSLLSCLASQLCHFDSRPECRHSLVKVLRLLVPVFICLWIPLKFQPEHRNLGHDVLESLQCVHHCFECKIVSVEWRISHLCQQRQELSDPLGQPCIPLDNLNIAHSCDSRSHNCMWTMNDSLDQQRDRCRACFRILFFDCTPEIS